jgi:hypothetical protein
MLLLSGSMVFAQNPLKEVVKMGFSDVAATKQRAEAGDAQAQLSLADTLSSNFKKTESLLWYRKPQNKVSSKPKADLVRCCYLVMPVFRLIKA